MGPSVAPQDMSAYIADLSRPGRLTAGGRGPCAGRANFVPACAFLGDMHWWQFVAEGWMMIPSVLVLPVSWEACMPGCHYLEASGLILQGIVSDSC